MTREEALDLAAGRVPVAEIPVDWERTGYTSESFDAWARSPHFSTWEGDRPDEEEVRVMVDFLGLKRGDSVLDLACGWGRHAEILAGVHGMKVAGVDVSPGLIDAARERARKRGLSIDYRAAQARDLELTDELDAAIVAFNSFSLFSPEDVPRILCRLERALRKTGKLFMDLDNREFSLRAGADAISWERWEKGWKLQEIHFHPESCVETCRDIYIDETKGTTDEFVTFKRLYSLTEVREVLSRASFVPGMAWGDWDGSPVSESKPKMILAAAKAAGAN